VCGGSLLFSHDDFCFHSLTLSVFVYKENSVAKEKKTFQNGVKMIQSVSGLLRDFAGRKRPLAWDCRIYRCYRWPTSPVEGPIENS
jgi:hypothetical protein